MGVIGCRTIVNLSVENERAPRLANLFVMRALGATRQTLAKRFGLTEGDVRALLAAWGEPARLQARRWRMNYAAKPPEFEAAGTNGEASR